MITDINLARIKLAQKHFGDPAHKELDAVIEAIQLELESLGKRIMELEKLRTTSFYRKSAKSNLVTGER